MKERTKSRSVTLKRFFSPLTFFDLHCSLYNVGDCLKSFDFLGIITAFYDAFDRRMLGFVFLITTVKGLTRAIFYF